MKVAIVAPCHIQPSKQWVDALNRELNAHGNATAIIVDDSDGKISLPHGVITWEVYDYAKQRAALGEELYGLFEQFHHSSACKNFGTWLAWRDNYDVIIVIDSDCIVPEGFIAKHLEALARPEGGWSNPLAGTGWYSRGFPYALRDLPKWAHMGLWEKNVDLYGSDRVAAGADWKKLQPMTPPYPHESFRPGQFFPLSGMNVSFVREAIPFMLFLPNFHYLRHNFSRHDDIWGGYIFQKAAQQKHKSLSYGQPIVEHESEVIPEEDAKEEEAMIAFENDFYRAIDDALVFSGSGCASHTGPEIFAWLSNELGQHEVFGELREALKFWAMAFS